MSSGVTLSVCPSFVTPNMAHGTVAFSVSYTTYVVYETENATVPWAILGVTNDGHTLRVTPLDMARIPVGVSFCFQENTPLTQGVFCYMLKLAEHAVREKLK